MNEINVMLIYPSEYDKEYTEIQLNSIQLQALLGSSKICSEGNYFIIKEFIFEDFSLQDKSYELTVILDRCTDR
jgi:hypothetical protein